MHAFPEKYTKPSLLNLDGAEGLGWSAVCKGGGGRRDRSQLQRGAIHAPYHLRVPDPQQRPFRKFPHA
jgi:hypothetical protein